MIKILTHRANVEGPHPASENSLAATRRALELGFGIETDLRRNLQGRSYIAHDLQTWTEEDDFKQFAALFRRFPDCTVAMNVKELGYEAELIALQSGGDLGKNPSILILNCSSRKRPGARNDRFRCCPVEDKRRWNRV